MQRHSLTLVLALVSSALPAFAADEQAKLAEQGVKILKTYCHRCHGVNYEVPGFDVLNRDILLARREGIGSYISAGKPEESLLWQRIAINGDMPPSGEPEPSAPEKELLKKWIEAGAPFPTAEGRPFKSDLSVIEDIGRHLSVVPEQERKFKRFFTFTNLHNNKSLGDEILRQHRAALSKLVNSLSWKTRIVLPVAIDAEETILQIDLRSYGWDKIGVWNDVEKAYPYALKYTDHPSPEMRDAARRLLELTGGETLWVRGDWFVANASRPPLYHLFVEIPEKDSTLQAKLNVDIKTDFNKSRLARAGFATSGVSSQNRLVDRHNSLYGAFWQSYDFRTNLGKGSLVHFPLGPKFAGNKFNSFAFDHDGGEIIFNLPNGLQGYMLVDKAGKRIDAGPTDIVTDTLRTSGSTAVVNGISCMACHKHGVIRFKDSVRDGLAVAGDVRTKVQELYPKHEVMEALLVKDENRFLKALDKATGPFLKVGPDADRPIRDFVEVINPAALLYQRDLTPIEAALELGIQNPEHLQVMVRGNKRLAQLGLGQFKDGATIKREQWDSMQGGDSLFLKTAKELDLGTPVKKKK
jgi:serine/threonine-protein kinase